MTDSNSNPELSAFLDEELSSLERQAVETQLVTDSALRERLNGLRKVDVALRSVLGSPHLDSEQFLRRLERRESKAVVHLSPLNLTKIFHFKTGTALAIVVLAGLLMIFGNSGQLFRPGDELIVKESMIAKVVCSIGTIEVQTQPDGQWEVWTDSIPIPLEAGASVRTRADALCEIDTSCEGTFRMNQDTLLILHRSDQIELLQGEVWCETGKLPLVIQTLKPNEATGDIATRQPFTCPAESLIQCRNESNVVHIEGVSDLSVTVKLSDKREYSIAPGERLSCVFPGPKAEKERLDRVLATSWQLPLLIQRPTDDQELQDLLYGMLAELGQSKMNYLYEGQIRSLGPSGTIPLLAFIKSKESRANPEIRHRAMQIVAELAPESTRGDFIRLRADADATIAELAKGALGRLDQEMPQ